jgi:hypothetical protein
VTREKSRIPRHSGCDAIYFSASAYKFNSIAPVIAPSIVPRRTLFFASKSRTMFKVALAAIFYQAVSNVLLIQIV